MRIIISGLVVALLAGPAGGADYYVATSGSNANSGTSLSQPFRTIQQAANVATAGDAVYVRGGTYRETVSATRSGTASAPITFQPYGNEQVTITGLDLLSGWSPYSGSIYNRTVNSASQVFINGKMMTEARWPNSSANNPLHAVYSAVQSASVVPAPATSTITDAALGNPSNNYWAGAQMATISGPRYFALNATITGQTNNTLSFQWNASSAYNPTAGDPYYLYGTRAALDASKEYYYDSAGKKLYLYAPGGADPNSQAVEVRTRQYGFNFGSQSYINVKDFRLMAANININVGGNHNLIDHVQVLYPTTFNDVLWGSPTTPGVTISGQYNTLRNSEIAYSWGEGVTLSDGNNLAARYNIIDNNVIHDVNWAGTNAGGMYTSADSTVTNNTIYNAGRFAIILGGGNSVIAHNNLSRFGYLTRDLGGIYTMGDDGAGTVIAYNRVHDSKSDGAVAGIYLDLSCSNFTIHNNLVSNVPTGVQINGPGTNVNAHNNTLWDVTTAMTSWGGGLTNVKTYNNLSNDNSWVGTDLRRNLRMVASPFVNTATGDYTLRSGTTPVDYGMTDSTHPTDPYTGSAPDAGAFELGTTPWTAGANWRTWLFADQTTVPLTSALYVTKGGVKANTGPLMAGNPSTAAGGDSHAFLKFDLSGVSGDIQSAVLRLYDVGGVNSQNGGAVLYQVLSDWTSSTVSYNQPVSTTGTSFYDPDNLDLYTDVDVTSIVYGWFADPSTNFGFSIRGAEGLTLSAKYFGGVYDVTPPQLLLTFVPEPGAFCLLASAVLAGLGILTWRKWRLSNTPRLLDSRTSMIPRAPALLYYLVLCRAFSAIAVSAAEPASAGGHAIEIDRPVLAAEEGLLLGNGDLSVSVYQTADQIIWRFGKGDVWDRRLDLSDDPKPTHIRELAHGIEVEGWKCGPYGGPVEATRGTKNPKRMREICQGSPPSYDNRPYPCPKPVGELALHFPPDLPGMTVRQRLLIEEAKLLIECSWSSGVKIRLESFVPPKPNVLVVRWRVENWNAQTQMGTKPPVWFSLYRWADPTIQAFAARQSADCHHGSDMVPITSPKITPLAPPATKQEGSLWAIEQTFPPDSLFPRGFRYLVVPFTSALGIEPVDMKAVREARLHIVPDQDAVEGQLAVAVATASDSGGPSEEIKRIRAQLGDQPAATLTRWADENRKAATAFWSHSRLSITDPLLENLWYETYHARRCAYRRGTIPPGLFLPSTVRDYSHWHGDYHTNYNIQEPFWGDYTANHLELGDAYFDAIAFALPIGRKIAKDYYGCRGAFIQLSAFPISAEDDPIGTVPMGRMAYMTGWTMNQYWWRYLYTLDKDWLRSTGYPVIRDCALFYTDFLKKRDDGLYHIFPSNQGEDGFTGNPKDCTDLPQVMQHMRYCLRTAIRASEVLGVDEDLRAEWRDRLDHAAGDDGHPPLVLSGLEKECYEANPPEFGFGRPFHPQPEKFDSRPLPEFGWYFGQCLWSTLKDIRSGEFIGTRDLPAYRHVVQAWRRPNGLVWAMAVANYGRAGAFTESLGVAAPLQEMMLQSWDGALRIFPAWPKNLDARFESFRAEGAFLVTAAWSQGQVTALSLRSEKGSPCKVYSPWPAGFRVTDASGKEITVTPDQYGRPGFATQPGTEYRLQPR